MKYSLLLCLLGVIFIYGVSGQATIGGDRRGLVLLDDLSAQSTYSTFFNTLQSRGYSLTFREATDPNLELAKYGEYLYDFLVLLCPRTEEFAGTVDTDSILNFIDDGYSVILAVDPQLSEAIREVASECGVNFPADGSYVIDHLHHDVSDQGDHTLITADDVNTNPLITHGNISNPILFRGIGLNLEENNELLIPILRASKSAYIASPEEAVGESAHHSHRPVLVAALQGRNSARVLISGSTEMFSDKLINSHNTKSGNRDLVDAVSGWVLKERGVLIASNVTHHLVGEKQPRDVYKVTDDLYYSVVIEEFDGKKMGTFYKS